MDTDSPITAKRATSAYGSRKGYDSLVSGFIRVMNAGIFLSIPGAVVLGVLLRLHLVDIPFFAFTEGLKVGTFSIVWLTIWFSAGMLVSSFLSLFLVSRRRREERGAQAR